jgi:hypothetical protein
MACAQASGFLGIPEAEDWLLIGIDVHHSAYPMLLLVLLLQHL